MSQKSRSSRRYISLSYLILLLLSANTVHAQFSESNGLKHPNFRTYSISAQTGKYTLCFDEFVARINQVKAIYLAHQLFDLNDKKLTRGYYFSKKIKKAPLTAIQLQNLSAYLNSIETSIIKYISKVITDPAKLKSLKRFRVKVENSEIELVQPDQATGSFRFSTNIVGDIFEHAVKGSFEDEDDTTQMPASDSLREQLGPANLNELFDDDSIIDGPNQFMFWVVNNQKYTPPCIPYISRIEFLQIIDNKNLFRKDLTEEDRKLLKVVRNAVSSKDYKGEYTFIDEDRGPTYFSILAKMINWNNAPADLKALYHVLKTRPLPDDVINEKNVYSDDDLGGYLKNESEFLVASNYITLEIYKYLAFVMAHEFYHAWFAPGEINPEREVEADRFATYIYLQLFSDATFQALFNFEDGKMKKYMQMFSGGSSDSPETNSSPATQSANLFSLFLGKPIDQIFKEVYEKTEFYEKPPDGFHLSISDREKKMKEITSAKSAEVMAYLDKYFKEKLKSQTRNGKSLKHHPKS